MRVHPVSLAMRYLQGRKTMRGAPYYGNPLFGCEAEAASVLQRFTGQDFGMDVRHWSEWVSRNRWVYYGRREAPPTAD